MLDLRSVARALGGVAAGNSNVSAPGPGHSGADRSLSVKLDPSAPEGFLVNSFANDPPIFCRDYVREKLGLPRLGFAARSTANAKLAVVKQKHEPSNSASALHLWQQGHDPRGTAVQDYLYSRPERLLLVDDLAGTVIRYHPSLFFAPKASSTPGMLALLRDVATDEACGIHRTFLDGRAQKLERRMLGRAKRAAVKLDSDDAVTAGLVIGEGIETCMAARLAGFRPVWCVGSANGIGDLPLLVGVDSLTILTENDAHGRNRQAVEACTERWLRADREVLLVEPLVGKDFADAWAEAQR